VLLKEQHKESLQYYSLGLVILTLPFPMIFNNIAIFIFVFFSLLRIKKIRLSKNFTHLIFPAIFILSLISLFYSCDILKGFKQIEKIIAFMVFYLFLPSATIDSKRLKTLLFLFANITMIALFYCLTVALFNIFTTDSFYIYNPETFVNEQYLRYHRLASALDFHAIYFSIFLAFAASIYVYYFNSFTKKLKKIIIFNLIVLAIGLYLLNSFAVLAAFFVISISTMFFFNHSISSFKKFLILVLILSFPTAIFINKAKAINTSFLIYNIEEDQHSKKWNSLNIRLAKWECAFEASKDSPVLGQGVGCVQTKLNEIYREKGFEIGYSKAYSTHNQYIHYLVELGAPGLIIFLTFVIMSFYQSLRKKDFLLFSIITLLAICSITENVLTLNKGIIFFTAFYYLINRRK
jgi:O-antigen ligase